jgi:hypothetical protein
MSLRRASTIETIIFVCFLLNFLKLKILEYQMSDAKIYRLNFLMQKKLNSNYLWLSGISLGGTFFSVLTGVNDKQTVI